MTNEQRSVVKLISGGHEMTDYWADGHYIAAESVDAARESCVSQYGHEPELIRPWTDEDQAEIDRVTA